MNAYRPRSNGDGNDCGIANCRMPTRTVDNRKLTFEDSDVSSSHIVEVISDQDECRVGTAKLSVCEN